MVVPSTTTKRKIEELLEDGESEVLMKTLYKRLFRRKMRVGCFTLEGQLRCGDLLFNDAECAEEYLEFIKENGQPYWDEGFDETNIKEMGLDLADFSKNGEYWILNKEKYGSLDVMKRIYDYFVEMGLLKDDTRMELNFI